MFAGRKQWAGKIYEIRTRANCPAQAEIWLERAPPSYLSEIENGKKDPSLRVLKTIADGFDLSLSHFLRGF